MLALSSFSVAILLYVGVALGLLLALALYFASRDAKLRPDGYRKSAFHCLRCNHIYAAAAPEGTSDCPACGHNNAAVRF